MADIGYKRMRFGQEFVCNICKKAINSDYHGYNCVIAGIDMTFYTCKGKCNEKFRGEYINPFKDEPIETRFEILDL